MKKADKPDKKLKKITKLNKEEFDSTFIPPMVFMDVKDETSKVDLKSYVESILISENLNNTIEGLSIDSIYHNADKSYEHVLLYYGVENMFIVIVIELKDNTIAGYHILDLNNTTEQSSINN